MKCFEQFTGLVAPMDRANVDTDLIIPKQYLKSIKRTGFGINLFDELRYLEKGEPGMDNSQRPLNPDFPLNMERYRKSSILLARKNFGCGSSREHAPWALVEYGFRVIIAPSFADIFYNNCFKNGLLPIILGEDIVDKLFKSVYSTVGYCLTINLERKQVTTPAGQMYSFNIEDFRQYSLLNGLDDIGLTLQEADKIKAYEARRKKESPWLFDSLIVK